ncbi:pescadillo [Tanacetum coccineum]
MIEVHYSKSKTKGINGIYRYVGAKERTNGTNDEDSELRLTQLQDQLPSNEPGALMNLVPRDSLLFVITSFGGVVSWEGYGAPFEESNQDINYQIVGPTQSHKFISRDYIQLQWVFDCINARIIPPTEDYMVGKVLPPHLSPFVDDEAEGYAPEIPTDSN